MRSSTRQKQDVWYAKVREELSGIDTIQTFDKPQRCKIVCSSTSGTPEEIAAGLVPDYERYLTYHKPKYGKKLELQEGMALWINVAPEFDEGGNLKSVITYETDENGEPILDEEGKPVIYNLEYPTPPDYVLKRILDTQKGEVVRYGIVKIGRSGA